jgi:hypothetical protein
MWEGHSFVGSHTERKIFFLDAASTYGFEAFSQSVRIHPGGRANILEIFVVVKKKLLCFAAKSQRAANPFFQAFCDHGAPKSLFRRSLIFNTK